MCSVCFWVYPSISEPGDMTEIGKTGQIRVREVDLSPWQWRPGASPSPLRTVRLKYYIAQENDPHARPIISNTELEKQSFACNFVVKTEIYNFYLSISVHYASRNWQNRMYYLCEIPSNSTQISLLFIKSTVPLLFNTAVYSCFSQQIYSAN